MAGVRKVNHMSREKKNILSRVSEYTGAYRIEWIVTIVIMFSMMLIYTYVDKVSLTIWSTNVLDCIANGNLWNYFEYTSKNLHNLAHADIGGTAISIIPIAIWNIPIWIAQYFFGVSIKESVVCMLWAELFSAAVVILFSVYVYRICMLLWNDKKRASLVILLSASSVFMHLGISYSGQTDIMWIAIGVVAVYHYLKGNMKYFFLLANLSIMLKPYFFIVCVTLLLFKEKDILKVLGQIAGCLTGFLLINIFLRFMPGYSAGLERNSVQKMMFRGYLEQTFETPYGAGSIMVLFFILFYIVCYIIREEDEKKFRIDAIYLIALVNVMWLVFAYENFYRIIMILPWIYILLLNENRLRELNLFVNLILQGVWMAVAICTGGAMLDSYRGMSPSILKVTEVKAASELEKGSIYLWIMRFFEGRGGYDTLMKMVYALWIGIIIFIFVTCFPRISEYMAAQRKENERNWLVRSMIWIHVLLIVPFVAFSCLCTTGLI